MHIDFSGLALSPNESRAARNFLGLSQAQAAEKSNLPAHKLKRFETGNYVPDTQFIQDLREFFEGQGYNFHDEDAPGAKAKARGDVFQAGVVGETDSSIGETGGSPSVEPGKPARPQKVNLQFMRIAPNLGNDQIDRVFDCIEENEAAIFDGSVKQVTTGFLADGPSTQSQAQAIALLRRLAENGLLYARLMGRDLLPVVDQGDNKNQVARSHTRLFAAPLTVTGSWATIGDLLQTAMNDMQLAMIDGDKDAMARRKGRAEPSEVLQALVG
nr:helix-turn-helix transcriptional regulator [uncultured Rhodoferax sp.]